MTDRIKEILSYYQSDNPGVLTNLARILNHGQLAGTGRLVILPVDQGFEHGPGRSFGPNPPAYDPHYHFNLALKAGCNAFAAPLGFLEVGSREFAGQIPLILKANSHDVLQDEQDPLGAQTASVKDALRLGCSAIGYTIYPGSAQRRLQYEQLRELILEAKSVGLAVVVWAYPRGRDLGKEDETALDVVAYAAHIAAELGAHIIKVKLPSAHIALDAAKDIYSTEKITKDTLTERVRHVVESAFSGRRIVIFSGGAMNVDEQAILEEVRAIRDGGGFGSIIGRNVFQRNAAAALRLLDGIMDAYK
jgi:class I fructose-bisphosphate aldolase